MSVSLTPRLLPPEINWAHRMLSQSSASSLLCWSCTHWLKRVTSVISDVPLSVATLRAESWALIRVLRSARLRHVSLTWLLSPPLARTTNDRPAVIFQPSDSYRIYILLHGVECNMVRYCTSGLLYFTSQRRVKYSPQVQCLTILHSTICNDKFIIY